MRKLRIASVLLLVQGVVMELAIFVALVVMRMLGAGIDRAGDYFSFALPFLNDNLELMMVMSGIFGVLRVVGAVGVLRNRLWGFALSVIMCGVTLVLMIFMLPAGIADGVLSGGALVLLLSAYFGSRRIIEASES